MGVEGWYGGKVSQISHWGDQCPINKFGILAGVSVCVARKGGLSKLCSSFQREHQKSKTIGL